LIVIYLVQNPFYLNRYSPNPCEIVDNGRLMCPAPLNTFLSSPGICSQLKYTHNAIPVQVGIAVVVEPFEQDMVNMPFPLYPSIAPCVELPRQTVEPHVPGEDVILAS